MKNLAAPALLCLACLGALEWILPGPPGRIRRLSPFLLPPTLVALQVVRAALAALRGGGRDP